jgi:hypothetical protein
MFSQDSEGRRMKTNLIMEAGTKSGVLTLPAPPSGSEEEGKLLIQEAKDYIAEPPPEAKQGERRAESKKKRLRNYTGDRLLKEEPKRYRLIASMRREGLSIRQTSRACFCDTRTVCSVERREAESVPSVKTKLIGTLGRVANMTAERMEEEIPNMNHAQLAVTCGIATDKLQNLTGDVNMRIELTAAPGKENIFDKFNQLAAGLMKTVQARVIEPTIPALLDQ